MDKLKQFIESEERIAPAPLETAPPQAWEQIEKRLHERKKGRRKHILLHYSKRVAAAILLLVLVGGGIARLGADPEAQFAAQYPELAETEHFYEQVLRKKQQVVSQKLGSAAYQQEIQTLETEYQRLKESLGEHTNQEQIINSMIQNYRLRLELLEQLLQQINEQEKDESDKNQSIS